MLDLNWPIQTVSGLTVILLPEQEPGEVVVGTYGPTGVEYGGAWERTGKCMLRSDPALDLMNVIMSDERPRWIILCNSPCEDHCADAETKKNSERVVYDGRFYKTKEAAERTIANAQRQNFQSGQRSKYDLKIACVTIHKPAT